MRCTACGSEVQEIGNLIPLGGRGCGATHYCPCCHIEYNGSTLIEEQQHILTHKQLVQKAAQWLRNKKDRPCTLVAAELTTSSPETPDAIGWNETGKSILIECKASRSDFRADASKLFRIHEESGMGDERYFLVSRRVAPLDELPEGWGLLVSNGREIEERVKPARKTSNKNNEIKMMMSIIRRLKISTAVFISPDLTQEQQL